MARGKTRKGKQRSPPASPEAAWRDAVAAYERGELHRARNAVAPLLEHGVTAGEPYLLAGLVEARLAVWDRAEPLLQEATSRLPEREDGWIALGNVRHTQGDAMGAAAAYRELLARRPDHVEALNNLGVAYEAMRYDVGALECFDAVLGRIPDHENALRSRPTLLARLGYGEAARHAYEDLLTRWPDDVGLRLAYAELLEQANEPDAAWAELPSGEAVAADFGARARREGLRARLTARAGDPEAALAMVAQARRDTGDDTLGYDEGRLLDRLGRYDEAMHAFTRANAARAQQWSFRRLRDQDFLAFVEDKAARGIEATEIAEAEPAEAAPVFLVGLPRSGTTLLDRILAAHPQVQVLEEYEALRPAEQALTVGEGAAAVRRAYWAFLERHVALEPGRVIVDKNPLHTVHLDIVQRVFPGARVIVAHRHPYDAALSCFMQDFAPSPVSIHFLDRASTARLCARLLDLLGAYEAAHPATVVPVRYEGLVVDFEASASRVLNALGLDWDEAVADFQQSTARAGLITTPSYEQVTRGLYRSAVERWRRYPDWLEPVRAHLRDRLAPFGYGE